MPAWRERGGGPRFVPPARRTSKPVLNGRSPSALSHFRPRGAKTSRPAPLQAGLHALDAAGAGCTKRNPPPRRRRYRRAKHGGGLQGQARSGRSTALPRWRSATPFVPRMAPHRRDGPTRAPTRSATAMTSARLSFRSSVSAPAVAIDVTPIAWQLESSMDSRCLAPASHPRVSRADSVACGEAGCVSCSRRPQRRAHLALWWMVPGARSPSGRGLK
jgi:hypothetical protein